MCDQTPKWMWFVHKNDSVDAKSISVHIKRRLHSVCTKIGQEIRFIFLMSSYGRLLCVIAMEVIKHFHTWNIRMAPANKVSNVEISSETWNKQFRPTIHSHKFLFKIKSFSLAAYCNVMNPNCIIIIQSKYLGQLVAIEACAWVRFVIVCNFSSILIKKI